MKRWNAPRAACGLKACAARAARGDYCARSSGLTELVCNLTHTHTPTQHSAFSPRGRPQLVSESWHKDVPSHTCAHVGGFVPLSPKPKP